MRLAGKLAAVLGGVLWLVLSATLFVAYRSIKDQLDYRQEASFRTHIHRLAKTCMDAAGPRFESVCLQKLYAVVETAEPGSFSSAYVVDDQLRILLHSDFLRNDQSRKGTPLSDVLVRQGIQTNAPFSIREGNMWVFGEPLFSGQQKIGTFVAVYNAVELARSMSWLQRNAWHSLAMASLIGSLFGVLLAATLSYYMLSPLDEIAQVARKVGAGEFNWRVSEGRRDELGEFAVEFNRMIGKLGELDMMKDSFLSKMTHDLRAPLFAIQGWLGGLLSGQKGPLTPAQERDLKLVLRNGEALAGLIDTMLEVARLEAGRTTLEKEKVDLESEIQSVLQLMQNRAAEFGVAVRCEADGLDEIVADPRAIRRVLTNLVSNALKFTPKGGQVIVRAKKQAEGVVVSVADTGIGIPKDRLGELFKKFSQVPETKNLVRESWGSGLGLVICKELVEAHGGRIWAESELHKGTAIHFTLPNAPASVAPAPA